MTSKIQQLEERVARLEREIAALKAARDHDDDTPWWKKIRGAFKDDEAYAEAARLGAEWRRSQREP